MATIEKIALEVCVDSIQSAVNAEKGGASRIELCSSLSVGGLTPSTGVLSVVKQLIKIPVFVMVRPREGDFCYSDEEFVAMKKDVQNLKQFGADGIVFGILSSDGSVDSQRCMELMDEARPLQVTFHRAFDVVFNYFDALETIIRLGFERVLTSGGENSALEGTPLLQKLVQQADDRIVVVAGGGISEKNISRILDETGILEFHASCRLPSDSTMEYRHTTVNFSQCARPSEFTLQTTCRDRVSVILRMAKESM